jgi:hypothetical protein
MAFDPHALVRQITDMQVELVARWHEETCDEAVEGFLGLVCQQHRFNYLLWHEEDIARSPDVGDARIAQVKRSIDRYNQQRNDWIEKLDDDLLCQLKSANVVAAADLPWNTETPGSAIDRLSIMALRLYHLREQLERPDAEPDHRIKVESRLAICRRQHADLSLALGELIGELFAGRKQLKLYRQFKMYNDPALNPYLYARGQPL